MGTIYRRQVKICKTCRRRLDTIAARHACQAIGHVIETREQGPWWIKYQSGGRPQCVSSGSDRKEDAKRLLREREHLVDQGAPIAASVGKLTFDDAAKDLLNDYRANGKRSLKTMEGRIENHLKPFF